MGWMTQASVETSATPEAVWALWVDVEGWTNWDHEVERAELLGPFEAGTKGVLKPKGGPRTSFTLTEVVMHRCFSDRSRLPLATLDFHHLVSVSGSTTKIEHRVMMTGPSTFVFRRLIGTKIHRGLPLAVAELARQAEGRT